MGPPDGGDVAGHGVGGEEEHVAAPPVASTTAWAACDEMSPVSRSRTTMPEQCPSITTMSTSSVRLKSRTPPRPTCRESCW